MEKETEKPCETFYLGVSERESERERGRVKERRFEVVLILYSSLSEDKNSEFGARVYFFLQTVLTKGNEPHQKLLSDVYNYNIYNTSQYVIIGERIFESYERITTESISC